MKPKLTLKTGISIPLTVAAAANRGLNLRKEWGRGGTAVGINTANELSKRWTLPLKKVLHIANYFPRHAGDNLHQRNPPSNGYIAWLLWGGNPGRRWAEGWKRKWEKRER